MRKLNIIGGGKVGTTLGYLLAKSARYQIQNIISRSLATSLNCSSFIGQGEAIATYEQLKTADNILIAVNDDQLPKCIHGLLTSKCLTNTTTVFHCSGAFSHEILLPLKAFGVTVASVHPIKSFSDPHHIVNNFAGTYCALEGDNEACLTLQNDFEAIGAKIVRISSENKILYHIATIFSSNYFVTLIETSLQLLEQCQINRDQGLALLEPLITGALQQVMKSGTEKALTGPIARGDNKLVEKQYHALLEKNPDLAASYKLLGKLTIELATKGNSLSEDIISRLRAVLM